MAMAGSAQPPGRWMPDWAWDVLAVLWAVAAGLAPFRERPGAARAPVTLEHPQLLVIVVAAALLLLLRRRFPLGVLAGTVVLLVVGAVLGGSILPFVLPVAIATFRVATLPPRRRALLATLAVLVVVVAVLLVTGHELGFDPGLIPAPAVVVVAAAAGDAARSRREHIVALAERAERAEATRESEARRRVAEERLRIARDLHDAVAHQIAVVNLQSSVAMRALAEGREPDLPLARDSLATVRRAAQDVLGEIGELLSMLRAESEGEPAPVAPPPGLAQLDPLVRDFAASGLSVTVRREGAATPLPASADRVAYLVLREALTNAHKHGSAHRAHVLLVQDAARLAITVTNPVDAGARRPAAGPGAGAAGPGTSPAAVGGHGLLGLRERVAAVGGTVRVADTGTGFRLDAELPLGRRAEHPEAVDEGEGPG